MWPNPQETGTGTFPWTFSPSFQFDHPVKRNISDKVENFLYFQREKILEQQVAKYKPIFVSHEHQVLTCEFYLLFIFWKVSKIIENKHEISIGFKR